MTLTGQTKVVGVWGHPVSHSRSPAMHNAALAALKLDWVYAPFDVAPENVAAAVAGLRALGLVGVNVTVPLKELVLPYLDDVDPVAARIGSVNTIVNQDGRLTGYSTDGPGFLRALEEIGEPTAGRRVLLLGAGGSARAVAFALAERGCRVRISNRTLSRAQELSDRVNVFYYQRADALEWGADPGPIDLLINTTTLGMAAQSEAMPTLALGTLRPGLLVYDLVYAPPQTPLLQAAKEAGCRTANGVGMLVQQGALSLSLWTGLMPEHIPTAVMTEAVLTGLTEFNPKRGLS